MFKLQRVYCIYIPCDVHRYLAVMSNPNFSNDLNVHKCELCHKFDPSDTFEIADAGRCFKAQNQDIPQVVNYRFQNIIYPIICSM